MDVVTLGELILDMFASEPGKDFQTVSAFLPVAGGAPANVAVAAAKLGARAAFIGKVGEDAFGRRLESVLKGYGVDTRAMRFDTAARTTLNFMTIPDPNRTEMLFYRNPGADMLLSPGELDTELLASTAVYHFGSVSLAVEPCRSAALEGAAYARGKGALVSFDVNYRPSLWENEARARAEIVKALPRADIVKVNETELRLLAGTDDAPGTDEAQAGCARILEHGPALCVATLGPHGSAWSARASAGRGSAGRVPGFTVEVVDATGCGDAFMAALLVRLLSAMDRTTGNRRAQLEGLPEERLAEALRWANAAGAFTARRKGVMPALPSAEEVNQLVR
jgi:sugar/nucleoside kinase (ribokinase family)